MIYIKIIDDVTLPESINIVQILAPGCSNVVCNRTSLCLLKQAIVNHHTKPSMVAKLVEHGPRVWQDQEFGSQSSQTNDFSNWYLSLPSLALGALIRYCKDWLTQFHDGGDLNLKSYKLTTSVHCQKSVPVLI